MKKAFTLIELIFVIVLIGFLSAVAIPHFMKVTTHSKNTAVKSTVSSILSEIENIRAKWIVNDTYTWKPEHGQCELNENGYPDKLDDKGNQLFECVMKIPPTKCQNSYNGCFDENTTNEYYYYFDKTQALKFKYEPATGSIVCENGINYPVEDCNQTLFQ